jgi:N-acyl-D-amino-acid deacylase
LPTKPSEFEVAKLAQFRQLIVKRWDKFFVMGDPPDYEPSEEMSIAAISARQGRPPDEVAYDYITEAENRYLYFPLSGDHEPIRQMLADSGTLLGLSDGGAHCASIVDAGVPSFMLSHWGRDRRRGPRLPIELLVKRQASETADFFGFSDRGRLAPGLRADLNLIDFDRLRLHQPDWSTTCRPVVAGSFSGSMATKPLSSPEFRYSSAASTPARCRADWCVLAPIIGGCSTRRNRPRVIP